MRLFKRMFCSTAVFTIAILSTTAEAVTLQPPTNERYALIYNGASADADSTEAIAEIASKGGLPIKYVNDLNALPVLLDKARVFIVGGTDDDVQPLLEAFTPSTRQALKAYLQNGGRYLGVCGGAFLASAGWHDEGDFFPALGLTPAESDAHDDDFAPKIYPITWLGDTRRMYYQAGPEFVLLPDAKLTQIIARYHNGQPAALINAYGHGKVAVSGPHPEAPSAWKDQALNGPTMQDNTHLAEALLSALLSEQSITADQP